MLTIARLFGKSPFAPLQTHMDKVASCLTKLPPLFEALLLKNESEIKVIAEEISALEREADLTKNDIRNHLPKSLFLPLDRETLLNILSLQDSLADQAEKIARLAAMRSLEIPELMKEGLRLLCKKSMEIFWIVKQVIKELEGLLESSFGGIEAEKVKGMVEQIAFLEDEAISSKYLLLEILYRKGENLPNPSFRLLDKLIEGIGELAHLSEKLANRIRMVLDLRGG